MGVTSRNRLCHSTWLFLFQQYTENICFFPEFPLVGSAIGGFYWLFLWNFKEIKHQPFSMTQPRNKAAAFSFGPALKESRMGKRGKPLAGGLFPPMPLFRLPRFSVGAGRSGSRAVSPLPQFSPYRLQAGELRLLRHTGAWEPGHRRWPLSGIPTRIFHKTPCVPSPDTA